MATMASDSLTRRFVVACGVLSQYVRAGGVGAPPAVLPPGTAQEGQYVRAGAPPAVLPSGTAQEGQYVRAGAPPVVLPPGTAQEGGAQAQQLTIFYGGRVVVLDGCPPEKAAELIRLAAAARAPREPALVDMPIARKASLRRFLTKRKDRATATAAAGLKDGEPEPEPAEPLAKKGKVDAGGEEGASTWLALGSMHAR